LDGFDRGSCWMCALIIISSGRTPNFGVTTFGSAVSKMQS
jgi:hypothetical protein